MLNAPARTVFDVITDSLAAEPTSDELLAYQLPQNLQTRANELVEGNTEAQLTFDEQPELFDFIRADQMIALLKTMTKLRLRNQDT